MPKIVDKEAKRRDIAKKAMPLFARKGYEKTSIRNITSTVGMGKGTFYDYFKDKEDILNEILTLMFAEYNEIIVSKLKVTKNPLEQLAVLLREGAKLGDASEQMTITYVDIWRRCVNQDEAGEHVKKFKSFLLASNTAIVEIIERAKAQKKISLDVDSGLIAAGLLAMIDGLCIQRAILKSDLDTDAVSNEFIKRLLEGMK